MDVELVRRVMKMPTTKWLHLCCRSRAQAHPLTPPCVVDALLQYSTRALTSCVLHREQWRTGTATVGGGAADGVVGGGV